MSAPARLVLIGVPIDAGASRPGALMGPAALRVAGLGESLRGLGHAVEDRGDIEVARPGAPRLSGAGATAGIAAMARALGSVVEDALGQGRCPVVMGGDHSLSMGSVAGVARHCARVGRPVFVLWIDAHADFNTPDTSPSGNLHGMSLALLCGEPALSSMVDAAPFAPIDPAHVAVFGARSLDAEEREALLARGVEVMDMRLIDETGVVALMRGFLARVAAAGGHLHVSFDLDALDPTLAPGVGTPVPGGLTYREAHLAMEMLCDSGLVGSLDLVELNPFLDHAGRSADLLVDLAGSLFGRRIVSRPAPAR